jgi:hypothetical protein
MVGIADHDDPVVPGKIAFEGRSADKLTTTI